MAAAHQLAADQTVRADGARIPARKAVELGLANQVVADPLTEATACAKRILDLPQQADGSTKRL